MVSLEEQIAYLSRIYENPKLAAFNNLLIGKSFTPPADSYNSETDAIYYGIVNAIHSNDKSAFETHYSKKQKSNPSKDSPSPFVNDDFLIFCLIIGISKFRENKTWIENIVSLRSRTKITITFENLLKENYFSKDNLYEIILMFFQFTNQSLINDSFLNATLKSITNNQLLFEDRRDFYIICSLRAYNWIIELKEAPDGSEIDLLRKFNEKFLKRIKILSWFVQSGVVIGILYICIIVVSKYPLIEKYIEKIGEVYTLLGLIGLSQIANLFDIVRRKSNQLILKLFGYPNNLLRRE